MPISPRRLVRWTAVVCLMIFTVVACWHDTAYAHGGVVLTVHSDGRGSVWVDVAWEDGHPVTESVAAAFTARSAAGQGVGPAGMAGIPGGATVRYEGTLAPGDWTVTVDAAAPGPGTCTAAFTVGPAAEPVSTTCGKPTPTGHAPADDEAGDDAAGGQGPDSAGPPVPWAPIVIATGVLLASAGALLVARRRANRPRRPRAPSPPSRPRRASRPRRSSPPRRTA